MNKVDKKSPFATVRPRQAKEHNSTGKRYLSTFNYKAKRLDRQLKYWRN